MKVYKVSAGKQFESKDPCTLPSLVKTGKCRSGWVARKRCVESLQGEGMYDVGDVFKTSEESCNWKLSTLLIVAFKCVIIIPGFLHMSEYSRVHVLKKRRPT